MIEDEQIRQWSLYITYDVRQYIQEHQSEYENFIKTQTTIEDDQQGESSFKKGQVMTDEDDFKEN